MEVEVKTKKRRRVYDADFKRESVNLCKSSGRSCREVEKELGIGYGILKRWVREFDADPRNSFRGNGKMLPTEAEFKKIQRELTHVKKERDILKKAVAIFSREPNRYMHS
jgi:transposase